MKALEDLIGKRFGILEVIEFYCSKNNRRLWNCKCDCGNTKILHTNAIKCRKNPSCGCISHQTQALSSNWKGHGELGLSYFNAIRDRSLKFNRDFNITIEYLWDLFLKQDRRCALTGLPLVMKCKLDIQKSSITNYASLDRINSKQGYIIGNVQWVASRINIMKLDYSVEEFKELCRLVTNYER